MYKIIFLASFLALGFAENAGAVLPEGDLTHISDEEFYLEAANNALSQKPGLLCQVINFTGLSVMFFGGVIAPSFLTYEWVSGATVLILNSRLDPQGVYYPSVHPDSIRYSRYTGSLAAALTAILFGVVPHTI
jgi:hypothetical protein